MSFSSRNSIQIVLFQLFPIVLIYLTVCLNLITCCRFDKVIDVQMPDIAGRKAILELYSKNVRYALTNILLLLFLLLHYFYFYFYFYLFTIVLCCIEHHVLSHPLLYYLIIHLLFWSYYYINISPPHCPRHTFLHSLISSK